MSNDIYIAVIADLKSKRDLLDKMIADLETVVTGIPVSLSEQSTEPPQEEAPVIEKAFADRSKFLGMSIGDATKLLLDQTRKKMRVKDITNALIKGGMEFSSDNPTNTVGSVLNRRQKKQGDIVSPNRGFWGLKEWYPGRTFGKKAKDEGVVDSEDSNQKPSAPVLQLSMPGGVRQRSSD